MNYDNSYLKAKLEIPEDGTFAQVRPMPLKRQSRLIVELSLYFLSLFFVLPLLSGHRGQP